MSLAMAITPLQCHSINGRALDASKPVPDFPAYHHLWHYSNRTRIIMLAMTPSSTQT